MADDKLRALWRAYQSDPSEENRVAYREARARAGLGARHSWKHQRDRLMRIFEEWASEGRASETFGFLRNRVDHNWAGGYADGTSAHHGIIAANWNDETDRATGERIHTPMSWLGEMFERLPSNERPEMDWQDTTSTCGGCNLLIRTEPSHMTDPAHYIVTDGDILCEDCCLADVQGTYDAVVGRNASNPERDLARTPGWFQAAWREHSRAERDEEQGFILPEQDEEDCARCDGKGGHGDGRLHYTCWKCNGSGKVDRETGEAA